MARFYGEVFGSARTKASRTGNKNSGIKAHIRGWDLGCEVRIYVNDRGEDEMVVSLTGGSNSPHETEIVIREGNKARLVNSWHVIRIVMPQYKQQILDQNN